VIGSYRDTVSRVESPEGIILELHPAGPYIRCLAWLVDRAIFFGFIFALGTVAVFLDGIGQGLLFIGLFLSSWFYPVVFEVFGNGATPGKRVFDLQVIKQNGTPVDLGASLIRNILRVVDFLPGTYAVGIASMLATGDFRRLGDLAAGTVVVYRRASAVSSVWKTARVRPGRAVVPAVSLTVSEQRSVVSFAGRIAFLGETRARELASIAAPRVDPRSVAAEQPVESLLGVAAWITGEVG